MLVNILLHSIHHTETARPLRHIEILNLEKSLDLTGPLFEGEPVVDRQRTGERRTSEFHVTNSLRGRATSRHG